MTQEKMNRISFLYKKSQSEGLTEEERQEQAILRQEYRDSVRASLGAQLNKIEFVEKDGSHTPLQKKEQK